MEADLVWEFARMCKLGMKLETYTLSLIDMDCILGSKNPSYNLDTCSSREGLIIFDLITRAWIQRFIPRHKIFMRRQTGKFQISTEAQERSNPRVAYFLGKVAHQFSSGQLEDDNV